MLTNVLLALVLSAAIALATGPKLIEWLRGHQMKTSENELGPKEHLKKRGTPIMGGLMIALGWELLSLIPVKELKRVRDAYIETYLKPILAARTQEPVPEGV